MKNQKPTVAVLALSLSCVLALLAPLPARAMEVAFERDSSLPLVFVNVVIKTGSVADPMGQSGISNFMGEMLLRGTRQRTKEQIDVELDQMGAKLEVEVRAEALIMRGAVVSSQADRFLKLLSEVVTQPSFPEQEIRKLRSEIISGIYDELGRDQTLASRRFTKFLFRGHPYGKPVLGTIKDIEKINRAQILAHYDRLIRDQKLLIVGAGDATEERIQAWSKDLAVARPGGEPAAKVSGPEDDSFRRLRIVDKPDRTQTQIYIGQIGVRMTEPEFFPLYVGNHVFGGGSFSARLMTEIRVKKGWSYGAYSNFRHGRQPRSWSVYLFPAAKDSAVALKTSIGMVEDLAKSGITQTELEFAKSSLINSSGFMFNTPAKRVENKVLEKTLDLPDGFMKTYGPEMQKVTLAQVNQALAKYLKPNQLAITVLGSAKDLKAPLVQAAGVTDGHVEVVPYTDE